MMYSKEVEEMCVVAKGANHGPAPIPEEGKWVQSKEIKDAIEIRMKDGKYIAFGIYNSYKLQQITQFIANYIAEKANGN